MYFETVESLLDGIMAIVTQTDKRTGITYAYETTYYWDKEKQQSRSKCTCVGKADPAIGDIIPTRGRAKKRDPKTPEIVPARTGPKPFTASKRLYFGAMYLLESFADGKGLTSNFLSGLYTWSYSQLMHVTPWIDLLKSFPFCFEIFTLKS